MGKKLERQIDILNSLVPGRRIKCESLATDYGVTTKTIKEDILDLSFIFPIDTYRGRGGGIQLRKGYIINGYIMKRQYLDLIIAGLILLKEEIKDPDIDRILSMVSRTRTLQ